MTASVPEPHISVVIKARNEEHQIAEAIGTAWLLADEIVVVDDRSEDKTAAVAAAAGARIVPGVEHHGRIDVLDRIGFEAALGTWILRMDADERMTASLAQELRLVAQGDEYDGCLYARKHIMFGGWARHGGWFRAQHLGFFRKASYDRTWDAALHSQVPVMGRLLTLPPEEALASIHLDYDSVGQFVRRSLVGYAATEAIERLDRGETPALGRAPVLVMKRFAGRYFVRQGYRDGARGFVLAALLAVYELCVTLYMWDEGRTAAHGVRRG